MREPAAQRLILLLLLLRTIRGAGSAEASLRPNRYGRRDLHVGAPEPECAAHCAVSAGQRRPAARRLSGRTLSIPAPPPRTWRPSALILRSTTGAGPDAGQGTDKASSTAGTCNGIVLELRGCFARSNMPVLGQGCGGSLSPDGCPL